MIAWFIRFGTAIFGDTAFGVRFAGILAMLVTQLLLADIARSATRDVRTMVYAVLMPEAALYYGLLMAKVSPDTAVIPFAVAMIWALVRLAQSGDPRWWLAAGVFAGLSLLAKFTVVMLLPAIAAFALVPDWRWRWLRSPYPYLAALIAFVLFLPVLIWNAGHDWASFRFQMVRATASHELSSQSLRTLGDFIGLQLGLVGFILLPVVLSELVATARRGYRAREPIAILLSTSVLVPFLYFLWRSLTLRIGDTWPMFMWPIGFAAAAINLSVLQRAGSETRSSTFWAVAGIVSGIAWVVLVFLYYVAAPWNFIGRADPIGGEAGFDQVMARA
jgi:4-amino-4-deoxy-L-arabinose transferase-like glycosyltransferase